MSNNIFNGNRFRLLFKQHFIHNAQFLWLSAGAFVGVVFIILCLVQIGENLRPHGVNDFQAFLIIFFCVFAILYVGHSFPAFRTKESTIQYLMMPASSLEKFLFEFVIRIVLIIIVVPILFWLTFNFQGYFFTIFSDQSFTPLGLQYLVYLDDDIPMKYLPLVYFVITGGVLFVLSLAFTGSAIFAKQPLVKSLFSVAVVVMFFVAYSFLIVTQLGIDEYQPPDKMIFIPMNEYSAFTMIGIALFLGTAVMLFVAFLKLKEREV